MALTTSLTHDLSRMLGRHFRQLTVLLATSVLLACSQSAEKTANTVQSVESLRQIEGLLLIKGSSPHIHGVLRTDSGQEWALIGASRDEITRWQRQRVVIQGSVYQPEQAQAGAFSPARFEVQTIRAAQ